MKCSLLILVLLLVTPHRLPAPLHELPDAPTPMPTPLKTHRATPVPTQKPKTVTAGISAEKQSRFAGSWVGTMPTFPWGNVEVILTVDPTGTTMTKSWGGNPNYFAKTQLKGDALQAAFPGLEGTWSVAPQSDGTTALVRLQALMNDQAVVFHRAASKPADVKPAK